MKHIWNKAILFTALAMALILGVAALAETIEAEPTEAPAIEETQPAEEAATEPATDAATTDDTALQDALNAYRSARQESRVSDIESELNGFVADGKLTQEQADLILNYYKEQEALRNGACPNCGYQFQNGAGKGGFGGRGNRGFGGKGGRGMKGFQQAPNAQSGAATPDAGAANGAAYEDIWTGTTSMDGSLDI